MNVLFVLHGSINTNSGAHVHNYANRLIGLGLDCAIAVPPNQKRAVEIGQAKYRLYEFEETLRLGQLFLNGNGPDIVHAWTPREKIRQFCQQLNERYVFKQVIHLEDNEELLCEAFTQQDIKSLRRLPLIELDLLLWSDIFHPIRGQEFLRSADGATVITERLGEFVPESIPKITLWASADETLFFEKSLNTELRRQLGIPDHHIVLVYTGNVHAANAKEVRSLYLAVALLNREEVPASLIRTGSDYVDFLGEDAGWCEPFIKNLGMVTYKSVPEVMAAADVFIQPGRPDRFNEYRFPSKIPEFFAIGRPVVLPAANIGLQTCHGIDAFVLPVADGMQIADAVKTIMGDKSLYEQLRTGALAFGRTQLNGQLTTQKLLDFYINLPNTSKRISNKSGKPVAIDTHPLSQTDKDNQVLNKLVKAIAPHTHPIPQRDTGRQLLDELARVRLLERYQSENNLRPLSYGTVRDYCDSVDHVHWLTSINRDLKDVQRPWIVKAILASVPLGAHLLEVGAGEPFVAGLLTELGYKVVVVDPYDGSGHGPTEYERFVQAYPHVHFIRALFAPDTLDLETTFDCIYSVSVLEHVHEPHLGKLYQGIKRFLRLGGYSIHAIDYVAQGRGAEFHTEQLQQILQYQARLAGNDSTTVASTFAELVQELLSDTDTYYLSAEGHNLWRGQQPYEQFPFRKCVSIQSIVQNYSSIESTLLQFWLFNF